MDLKTIMSDILSVASGIEYNTISYSGALCVKSGKKSNPADLITAIAARFQTEITRNITPDHSKVKSAVTDLKKIAKDYKIEELRTPIKNLEAFLKSLG